MNEQHASELCDIVMAGAKVTVRLRIPYLLFVICLVTSQTKGQEDCQDGTYTHGGRICCKCPAGSKVQAHCTDQKSTLCEACVDGKEYQPHASAEMTCERCTSCEHQNANLEVDRKCTPLVDSTCKCKKNHYCHAGTDTNICKICEPCRECGSEGFRVACSASNNTVCNEKPRDKTLAITLGTLAGLAALAVVLVAVYFWKKRTRGMNPTDQTDQEHVPLQQYSVSVPLSPHIPDIAVVIGWKHMRNLAMNSKMHKGKIDSCEQDYPNDTTERTIALLGKWDEKEGREASRKLIQYLRETQLNRKADDVLKILGQFTSPENV